MVVESLNFYDVFATSLHDRLAAFIGVRRARPSHDAISHWVTAVSIVVEYNEGFSSQRFDDKDFRPS